MPSRSSGRARAAVDRRRWYVRTGAGGRVVELWSAAARPSEAGGAETVAPPREPPGAARRHRVAPLSHGGNSGAAVVRAPGTDGSVVRPQARDHRRRRLARPRHRRPTGGRPSSTRRAHSTDAVGDRPRHRRRRACRRCRLGRDARRAGAAARAGRPASREQSRRILDAAAQLHRAFRDQPAARCRPLRDRIGMSPAGRGRRGTGQPRPAAQAVRTRLGCLPRSGPAPTWPSGARAHGRARAVAAALAGSPRSGDAHPRGPARRQLRLRRRSPSCSSTGTSPPAGTPTVEFAWYLAHYAWRIDATHDELEADHRAAQGGELADAEVELGMLSGLVSTAGGRPQRARPSRPGRDRMGPRRAGLVGAARAHRAGATRRSAAMKGQTDPERRLPVRSLAKP